MNLSEVAEALRAAIAERNYEVGRFKQDEAYRENYLSAQAHVENLMFANEWMIARVLTAVAGSDQDVSPCRFCSTPILCIPDGLPCCEACAKQEASR